LLVVAQVVVVQTLAAEGLVVVVVLAVIELR
jgi:hypothetical protein